MTHTIRSLTLAVLLAAAGAAHADPMPHGGPGAPPPPFGAPAAESLAMIDGLSTSQQIELRKILLERRDAEDALRSRTHADREALDKRERAERDRLDDQTAQRLRTALGENGYRAYARWLGNRGPHPMMGPAQRPGAQDQPPRGDAPMMPPPAPAADRG